MQNQSSYAQTLKETLIETLLPPDDDFISDITLVSGEWWAHIGVYRVYLGSSFESALVTASEGDWVNPIWDDLGPVIQQWFHFRSNHSDWKDLETSTQQALRLGRINRNSKFSVDPIPFRDQFLPAHPELDLGSPVDSSEVAEALSQTEVTTLVTTEIEFLAVSGMEPGLFILSDDNESLTPVRFHFCPDGYSLHIGKELIPAQAGIQLSTLGRLILDEDSNFLSYSHFVPGVESPVAVYRKVGDQITLERFRMG
jgi:hypothetical protein